MHKVYTRQPAALESFEDHYAATGYALHYTACAGEPTLLMADPESSKVSAVFTRGPGWAVKVERFGTGSDAERAFSRVLREHYGTAYVDARSAVADAVA